MQPGLVVAVTVSTALGTTILALAIAVTVRSYMRRRRNQTPEVEEQAPSQLGSRALNGDTPVNSKLSMATTGSDKAIL